MSDQGYAERREAQRQADRSERAQIITRAWNAYLNDVALAQKAMPGHPDDLTVDQIIACRMALQACWSQLDTIEVQLPAARSHVTTGIEERTAEQLHGLAFVGCELGRAS